MLLTQKHYIVRKATIYSSFRLIQNQKLNANLVSGNIVMQISDHLPQFLILQNINVTQNKTAVLKSHYSNCNKVNFVQILSNQINFGYLNESSTIYGNYD